MWAVNFGTLAMLGIILYSPLNAFLKLAPLSVPMLLKAVGIAAVAVFWYELVKLVKKLLRR
jgi:Ca2+-transporting ATPase